MKLGTKILLAGVAAVVITAGVGLLVQRTVIRNQGIELTRAAMRGAVLEAENVRASISSLNASGAFDRDKLLAEVHKASDIRSTAMYNTIPVVAAWKAIEVMAEKEGYGFRVPKHQARNPLNEPTEAEAAILKTFGDNSREEYFAIDEAHNQLVYARPIKLTADCLACHGDPKTSPTGDGLDMLGYKMENWKTGETRGAFVLTSDLKRVDDVVAAGMMRTMGWIAPLVIVVAGGFFWLNRRFIVGPLSAVIGVIGKATQHTTAASNQIAAASQSLAQGATEQAASLEETSSALEQMSSMTKQSAEGAGQASGLSADATRAAGAGNAAMQRMTAAIEQIQSSATETAKIIKVIDEIAFQTNLLALNAAVEAARAGEAGAGFAVVAGEVRNLAMRSAEAARSTSDLIEQSVAHSRGGVAIVAEVATSLGEIDAASNKVKALIDEIAAAAREQATGIDQVNKAVRQMDLVTQQNAAGAEESASASQQLSQQAGQLTSAVEQVMELVGSKGDASDKPTTNA